MLQRNTEFDKVHARGFVSLDVPRITYEPLNLQELFARCKRIDITSAHIFFGFLYPGHIWFLSDFYEDIKSFAEYGPAFQRVVGAYQNNNEVLVLVDGSDTMLE